MGFGARPSGTATGERPGGLGPDGARAMTRAASEGGIDVFGIADLRAEGTCAETTFRCPREEAARHEASLATQAVGGMRPGPGGQGLSRHAILHEMGRRLGQRMGQRLGRRMGQSLRRLGTGPFADPPVRPLRPLRGDDGDAPRRGEGRQGTLYRRVLDLGPAVRPGLGASSRRSWSWPGPLQGPASPRLTSGHP